MRIDVEGRQAGRLQDVAQVGAVEGRAGVAVEDDGAGHGGAAGMGRAPADEGAGAVEPGLEPGLAGGTGGGGEVVPGREVEEAALGEEGDREEGQEEEGDEPGDAEEGEHGGSEAFLSAGDEAATISFTARTVASVATGSCAIVTPRSTQSDSGLQTSPERASTTSPSAPSRMTHFRAVWARGSFTGAERVVAS